MKPIKTIKEAMKLPEGMHRYEYRKDENGEYRIPIKITENTTVTFPPGSITQFKDEDGHIKKIVLTHDGPRKVVV